MSPMPTYALAAGTITLDGIALFTSAAEQISLEVDPSGVGAFVHARHASNRHQRHTVKLGAVAGVERFTATHRTEPFWMLQKAGAALAEVPAETQWLLARLADGRCLMVVPLCNAEMRYSVQGAADHLALVGETGDAHAASTGGGLAAFIAVGKDPFALVPAAARAVMTRLGTGRLRGEKRLPAFVDVFGWCTWDAFYQDVSQAKVREGLESFAKLGIRPRSLILDDGWQSERVTATGERRLTAFPANAKFPGDLKPTVAMAKGEFGIETFMVWHAVIGYWGGVDGAALPGYGVHDVARRSSPTVAAAVPTLGDWWGNLCGVVPPATIGRFYSDYHRHLRSQGVDGVKVDNQAVLETVADGSGGRVAFTAAYREGLEGSAAVHFQDVLINCMSCATETWYGANTTNLIRTSTDFWPNRPESHGLHLCTNSQVSLWFGEFIHADWDMFQSGHAMGAYHAAGRAVSGAPIYVSDKPGIHNATVLRKLVCSDGSVLRCLDLGRPTPDCLYHDCTREDVLLKIFNRNAHGWVVGVFNARYHAEERERKAFAGGISPAQVPGILGKDFVLHAHNSGLLSRVGRDGRLSLILNELSFEVITLVPVAKGFAAIGLADKYNASGAIAGLRWDGEVVEVDLRDGGAFLAWSERRPARVSVGGKAVAFTWDKATGALGATLPAGRNAVRVAWGAVPAVKPVGKPVGRKKPRRR